MNKVARSAKTESREPPPDLFGRALELWRYAVIERHASIGRIILIESALRDLAIADRLHQEVERDGPVITSRRSHLSRPHPCLRSEALARQRFERAWRRLGLHWDIFIDGRVP